MIFAYIGGIGSGKTISCIKNIVENEYTYPVTNFKLKNWARYHRLKIEDVILTEKDEKGKPKSKINWAFWNELKKEYPYFCVYLDEIHNLIHARRSMSKTNILMNMWISQIRKILSDSVTNNLYIISQRVNAIDVGFRDLVHIWIECEKLQVDNKVFIINKYYENLMDYDIGEYFAMDVFQANKYFQYYDSYEIVFGEEDIYLK